MARWRAPIWIAVSAFALVVIAVLGAATWASTRRQEALEHQLRELERDSMRGELESLEHRVQVLEAHAKIERHDLADASVGDYPLGPLSRPENLVLPNIEPRPDGPPRQRREGSSR